MRERPKVHGRTETDFYGGGLRVPEVRPFGDVEGSHTLSIGGKGFRRDRSSSGRGWSEKARE